MAPFDASTDLILPPLPFAENALEPTISARTLSFHHGKHHKAYVDKTNELLRRGGLVGRALVDVLRDTVKDPKQQPLFNNAAQVWNHNFYWQCLSLRPTQPSASLRRAIDAAFGDLDRLKKELLNAGMAQFGTGWAWLILENGKLVVIHTADADTPIAHAKVPLLTLDVWEHAYYLDYQHQREAHLKAVIDKVLNWTFVSENFEHAMAVK